MQLWRHSNLLYQASHAVSLRKSLRQFSASVKLRGAKTTKDVITEESRTRNIGIIAHIDAVSAS